MKNDNTLLGFGAYITDEVKSYMLELHFENQSILADKYPKTFDVVGYIRFKSVKDIETYLEQATHYLEETYNIKLKCNLKYWDEYDKDKGGHISISFAEDGFLCFIDGRFDKEHTIKVFSFA